LIPASAPLVQDIADFWLKEYGLDPEGITRPAKAKEPKEEKPSAPRAGKSSAENHKNISFTHRQG
jgi:hypothetical protein